jgi:hypothetical protein
LPAADATPTPAAERRSFPDSAVYRVNRESIARPRRRSHRLHRCAKKSATPAMGIAQKTAWSADE